MRWINFFLGALALNVAHANDQPFMKRQIQVLTPPSSPQTRGIYTFVSGDFLYWIAREDGLEYDLQSSASLGTVMEDIEIREPVFEWKPGFRATFGVRLPQDNWELKGVWSHLQTQASQTAVAIPGTLNNVVYDDTAAFTETTNSTAISSEWRLLYNQINAGISRGFFLGENLSSELAFGGVALWIHQKLAIDCPNFTTTTAKYTTLPSEFNLTPHFKNDYQAGGLFISMRPQWNFFRSWSLLTCGTGYLVHGNFHLVQSWSVPQLHGNDLSLSKKYTRTRVGLQGSLGIQWQNSTLNEHWHLAISAAYEGMIWFKQNLWSQVNTIFAENYERRGDLEMQGVTVSARLDF